MLTDQKIPVRLSLESLTSGTCVAYAKRHCLAPIPGQPHVHPLMHQIGTNPDCVALGLVAGDRLAAHTFFHYRAKQGPARKAIVHTFAVHPHLRGRGFGSLMAFHLLKTILHPAPARFELESECPAVLRHVSLLTQLCPELGEGRILERGGDGVLGLLADLDRAERPLTERILHGLITEPDFSAALLRRECSVAAASADPAFFSALLGLPWPAHAAVHPIQIGADGKLEPLLEQADLLIVHQPDRPNTAKFLDQVRESLPQLPIGLIADRTVPQEAPLVFQAPMAGLLSAMKDVLRPFAPAQDRIESERLKSNLLHLPEPMPIARFRGAHKGERLFIAASGPSLSSVDPALLSRETVLTINDALLHLPGSRYAAIMDSRKLHDLHRELLSVEAVFTLEGNSFGVELKYLGTEGFTSDVEKGVYSGYTTTYFALQIAVFLGFRTIYLVGLDLAPTADRSHFFGNRPLQDRDRPEVYEKMQRSFEQAAPELERLGVKVFNCSPVSQLKRFPRVNLREAVRT